MIRRALLLSVTFAALALTAIPASAGGGGCHGNATEGTGDTVEMVEACFTPTILQAAPGDDVTFINRDEYVHNVAAAGWGTFDDLHQGDTFTATFAAPGVFPYACTYHPAMTGAVVVGEGWSAGDGTTVSESSFDEPPEPSPVVQVQTITEEASTASVALGWIAGGAIGLVAGLSLAAARRRLAAKFPAP